MNDSRNIMGRRFRNLQMPPRKVCLLRALPRRKPHELYALQILHRRDTRSGRNTHHVGIPHADPAEGW